MVIEARYEAEHHALETVHNYNERLLLSLLNEKHDGLLDGFSEDEIADVYALTLNHLPPRYIRYDVDFSFHIADKDLEDLHKEALDALIDAVTVIKSRRRKRQEDE